MGADEERQGQDGAMPTLFRLLTVLAIIVGLVYGAMYALATFVKPTKGEMTERIPVERLNPPDQ